MAKPHIEFSNSSLFLIHAYTFIYMNVSLISKFQCWKCQRQAHIPNQVCCWCLPVRLYKCEVCINVRFVPCKQVSVSKMSRMVQPHILSCQCMPVYSYECMTSEEFQNRRSNWLKHLSIGYCPLTRAVYEIQCACDVKPEGRRPEGLTSQAHCIEYAARMVGQ